MFASRALVDCSSRVIPLRTDFATESMTKEWLLGDMDGAWTHGWGYEAPYSMGWGAENRGSRTLAGGFRVVLVVNVSDDLSTGQDRDEACV